MEMKDSLLQLLMHNLKRRCYRFVTLEVFCQNLWPLEFGYYDAYVEQERNHGEEVYLKRSRMEDELIEQTRINRQAAQNLARKEERRLEAQIGRNLQEERELLHKANVGMDIEAKLARKSLL